MLLGGATVIAIEHPTILLTYDTGIIATLEGT
jgi:hypothetical protein